eukprot:309602_1
MYKHIVDKIKFPRKGLNPNLKYGSFANLVNFEGNIMILGFGSIGQGVLPLVLRHFNMPYENIKIVTAPDNAREAHTAGEKYGVGVDINALTTTNYREYISSNLSGGDLLLNVSVDVSSIDVMEHCINNSILYSDTVIEPWKGVYFDADLSVAERSNYFFREQLLDLKRKYSFNNNNNNSTAISCHGANPGLVNHFVKQGLMDIANDINYKNVSIEREPETQTEWAQLASDLNIKCIHISERDTQSAIQKKEKNQFVNTWSVDSFIYEGWAQVSELGWGTHELCLPFDGEYHTYGNKSSIYLKQPGMLTKVRSWAPIAGPFIGWCVTHNESITISDYLSVYSNENKNKNKLLYRPTVHYAYHPCDDAVLSMHEFIGSGCDTDQLLLPNKTKLLLFDDITHGIDELGVLLCGHEKNAYWYGSQLDICDVADRIEDNQATSLQVTATLLAGAIYAINNKELGILEVEDLDYKYILDIVKPYVDPVVGKYTDWTPIQNRNKLGYDESINMDENDVWQFRNIRCLDMNMPFSFDQLKQLK